MSGKPYLGEFEQMVLLAILRLGATRAYGAAIIQEIRGETGRQVPSGSLSLTLDRLEAKGYLTSRMAEPDARRGGRPKRFVTVSPVGFEAVKEARTAMLNLWNGLEGEFEGR